MNNFNYESPIELMVKDITNKITEQREQGLLAILSEELDVKIDKPRLLAALRFDKTECEKFWKLGYDSGYEDAQNDILADILPIFGLDISQFKKTEE